MNDTGDDEELLLKQTQKEILQRLLPDIISLVIFCAIGIFGNILTLTFYAKRAKRSSTLIMITSLAAVDVAVCIALILSIWELAVIVTSYHSAVCKLTHFFGRWTVGSSCFVLWIISIDRHRKICKPFGKQVTVSNAKHVVTGLVLFALLLSIKELVHYSSIEILLNTSTSNGTITGYYCKEIKGPGYRISIFVFNAIDMILFAIIWVTQVVVYTLIIYSLVKIRQKVSQKADHFKTPEFDLPAADESLRDPVSNDMSGDIPDSKDKDNISRNTISTLDLSDFTNNATNCSDVNFGFSKQIDKHTNSSETNIRQSNNTNIEEFSFGRSARGKELGTIRTNNGHGNMKVKAIAPMEMKLTLMLFSVSLVFVLCFTPYFVMIIWALDAGKEYELEAGIKFAIRLPYLNSVFNPFIYCIFNSEFRSFVKVMLKECCPWNNL
ncbi:cholecystokinin receptor type A-like [Mercenaria mercenaria]|uniref:cholecystokinin receptor type A-like n=1 Tax=Mercenaria mercenaria TaxID=6596 RepID=UPI001E1D5BFB|nr:cholecystokinin receptor type A-like [Mercenaria mercenaria]